MSVLPVHLVCERPICLGRAIARPRDGNRTRLDECPTYVAAMQLLNDAHYGDFKDQYAGGQACEVLATDNLSVEIVVADAVHRKTIDHYLGCEVFPERAAFIQLEDHLDAVLKTRRFTQIRFGG